MKVFETTIWNLGDFLQNLLIKLKPFHEKTFITSRINIY